MGRADRALECLAGLGALGNTVPLTPPTRGGEQRYQIRKNSFAFSERIFCFCLEDLFLAQMRIHIDNLHAQSPHSSFENALSGLS